MSSVRKNSLFHYAEAFEHPTRETILDRWGQQKKGAPDRSEAPFWFISTAYTNALPGMYRQVAGYITCDYGVAVALTASTRVTFGTERFRVCSMPARSVIVLIGHDPHAPKSSSSTT